MHEIAEENQFLVPICVYASVVQQAGIFADFPKLQYKPISYSTDYSTQYTTHI